MKTHKFTFIDLFAGIGGTRIGLEAVGGKAVFSSEWDANAQKTYFENFYEMPTGDIRQTKSSDIPDHDVLAAGFPCQPFSIAGVSKKKSLDMPTGFADKTQGTLFFEVARILKDKKPKAFILENVRHLKHHDRGRTFKVIMGTLDELGYDAAAEILDARFLVPQHRERIFIVGFRGNLGLPKFCFPKLPDGHPEMREILEKNVDSKYTLTNHLWEYLQKYAKKHKAKGNGFGYGLAQSSGIARTLSARYYKDGSEILIPQTGRNPRRLTPRECARLMGFPDTFKIPVSDTQAYRQFGNSVVPAVVEVVGREMVKWLSLPLKSSKVGYRRQAKLPLTP